MRISRGNIQGMGVLRLQHVEDKGTKDQRLAEMELEQTKLRAQIALLQQQQKVLQDSRDLYASHYEHAPIGYVTFGPDTTICDINPATEKLLGSAIETLINTPFSSIVAPSSHDRYLAHLNRCLEGNAERVITEVRLQKCNGETIPVQLVSTVFSDQGQRLIQTALIDLTEQKQHEGALAEAKEFAESVVDTVREPLIVLDSNLKVVSVNRAFTAAFNKTAKFAKSRQFDVLLNLWWSGNKMRNELENVLLKNSTLENLELEVELKDMGKRILLVNARRLYRKAKLPPQILVAVKDITEKKAAEEKIRKSGTMLAEAQRLARIGSWEWDIARDMVTWSEELYRLFNVKTQEFRGTFAALLECVHPEDRLTFEGIIQDVSKTNGAFDFVHRTGCSRSVRALHCRGYVVADEEGNAVKVVGTMQDVTERKEAEDRLHQLNIELEGRVTARTEALQQSYQQMEAFCYSIAHDLRAPLRAMKGFGHALLEDYGDSVDAEGREYIDRIVTAADRMDLLINDLLDYGRLNTINLPIGRVDAEEILSKVLSYLELKPGIVTRKKMPLVLGHGVVLELALRNIIENALKFIAPEIAPRIRIWSEEQENVVRISIADNGIGIAQEHQDRIFQVFQRLHTDTDYPGTGIGLAIVAKGIQRIGGRVGVESQLGKGSRFWIELPKA